MTVVDLSGTSVVIDDLVKEARAALADGTLSFGEVVHLGGVLASKVSQFARLSGKQKQTLVIRAVEVALEQVLVEAKAKLVESEQEEFQKKIHAAASFAKETLPAVLDVAVQAAKGQLNLLAPETRRTLWAVVCAALRCAGVPAPEVPKAVEMVVLGSQEPPKEVANPPADESKAEEVRPASTVSQ